MDFTNSKILLFPIHTHALGKCALEAWLSVPIECTVQFSSDGSDFCVKIASSWIGSAKSIVFNGH